MLCVVGSDLVGGDVNSLLLNAAVVVGVSTRCGCGAVVLTVWVCRF